MSETMFDSDPIDSSGVPAHNSQGLLLPGYRLGFGWGSGLGLGTLGIANSNSDVVAAKNVDLVNDFVYLG